MKILIIEDNPGDVRLIQEMIKGSPEDFTIDAAEELAAGLNFLGSHDTDVVLLDLGLPDSSGLGTLTRLQARFPQLPVMVMTSIDDEALAVEAVRLGAGDYLVKGQIDARLLRRTLLYSIERKKTQAKLAHLASFPEFSPNPIVELDLAGNISYMNPIARRLFPEMNAVGSNHPLLANWDSLADMSQSAVSEPITRELNIGDTWYEQSIFYVPPSQSIRFYCRNITERRKLEQLKDEFISLVSHELRTPLTVIIGALNTILSESENLSQADVRQLLQDAALEAESLSNLVGNLLELSRFQAQQLSLYTEAVDVNKVVHNTVDKIKRQTASHRFSISVPGGLPPVKADSIRLERILYNLLDNAVKYSPAGSQIKITARADSEGMVVGVSDEGTGISVQDQMKLFGPFQRLEQSKINGTKGLGLGLVVCRRLAEAHGGRIWVESKPGHGSTFFFSLPLGPKTL